MKLTRLAVRNAQFLLIVILILVVISVRSFQTMPRSEDPQADFPIYRVLVVYPGTSPEDMEELIIDPIEEVINEVEDIDHYSSVMREGVAFISINASYSIDTEEKYDELVREINRVRPDLPSGIVRFEVEQIKPGDRVNYKLVSLSSSSVAVSELTELAEELEDDLEAIEGISSVVVDAGVEKIIKIALDFERMSSLSIGLGQVLGVFGSNNVNIPGGDIDLGGLNFSIKSSGDYNRLDEIKETVISSSGAGVVYLKDIATVDITEGDRLWEGTYQKKDAVFVGAKLKRGYNIINVDKTTKEVLKKFEENLPASITIDTCYDQTPEVANKINDFFNNLLQGVILVGIIILLFLGWRAAFIIITLIPLCIILAIALLNGTGYGLQQISIASLVLALGLLVDNGIVVIENITRMIREGMSKKEAALAGAEEVGPAIVSSTATTLLSFFPLTQLGEGAGLFLRSLPLTVIFTLIISLILALTFSPIVSGWVMDDKRHKPSLADKIFHWFSFSLYRPVLEVSLRYGFVVILVALTITAFSFVSVFPKVGVSFFPTADKPVLLIDIDGPKGTSKDYTRRSTQYVESILDTMDIVKSYVTSVGNSNSQIYYNRIPKSFNKSHGQVLVNLKSWNQSSFYNTIANLRSSFSEWPDTEITVEELKNGAPVEAPIEIRIFGQDLEVLSDLSGQVENILESYPDVINIKNPLTRNKTELTFALDKAKAGLLGVSPLDFDRTIRAGLNGLVIGEATLSDDETYPVEVGLSKDGAPGVEDFYRTHIQSHSGASVPLHHISRITLTKSAAEFSHYDGDRYIGVLASLVNLDNTIPRTLEVIDQLEIINWPDGYSYVVGGEYEEQQSTFGNLGIILILAQIAIFAVLVLQFRSVLQPLIVFSAIPLAACGSILALYLSGWPFSFFAFVGLISLIGIVVNNSIILVDYINQLRVEEENISLRDAIIEGSIRRFKPIILTTLTTILGLLPLTLQSTNQWSPLCFTIIGGMISSTLLTLLVVPVLYKWLTRKKGSLRAS